VSSAPRDCPACGSPVLFEARFCARCGARLDVAGGEAPGRHLFGVLTAGPAFVFGCVLLVAGVLALVAGSPVAAIALLAFSGAIFVLSYGAAERDPDSAVTRAATSVFHKLRGWGFFATESTKAWSGAARDVARLRRETRSLQRERRRLLMGLGDAAYREDATSMDVLRSRLSGVDEALRVRERERSETVMRARRIVRGQHEAAQATRPFSVRDLTSGAHGEQ
jgi:hypothetical protein